jgi:serine/threonine protein kinase
MTVSTPAAQDNSEELLQVEVRWMTSGETVCSLRSPSMLHLSELKAQVHEYAGIPVDEQRLFWDNGAELDCDRDIELRPSAPKAPKVSFTSGTPVNKALLLVRCVSDPRITNLGAFRSQMNFPALPSGAFTKVHKISEGINGSIMLYNWHRESGEIPVAVKMLRNNALESVLGTETDERLVHIEPRRNAPLAEDALTEIGILTHLSNQSDLPASLLRMHGVFASGNATWLVTEYAEGGELFQVVASSGPLPEAQVKQYTSELLQAVSYLHRHNIGHRDISLENILLKEGTSRLMDFGMAVRSHSASGTPLRYFRAVGKSFYRAPECYVPVATDVRVTVAADQKAGDVVLAQTEWKGEDYLCEVRLPEYATPGKTCKADVWGYTTSPADVWAVGVCCFIMGFECPPWSQATLDDDSFGYIHAVGETGLEAVLLNWGKELLSQEAMQFIKDMLRIHPRQRPSAAACVERSWLGGGHDLTASIA